MPADADASGACEHGGPQAERDEAGTPLALRLEELDGLDADVVRLDDDVAQALAQHGLDRGLQLGRRLHDVGHHPADPRRAAQPFPLAVLLHDGAHALLEALVAVLNLDQRSQARAAAVRLLAQRLELHLAARHLGPQVAQARLLLLAAAPPSRPAARAAG